ncbi:hypothetical protein Tco_0505380 [Tanacetum coccineum]
MSNMSEDIQYAGSDTRPPMLDRAIFESWLQRSLYCLGKSLTDLSVEEKERYKAEIGLEYLASRTSSNARNNDTVQDGRVVVQDVRGRYNANNQGRPFQRNNAREVVGTGNVRGEQTMFMANLTSEEAGPSYDSNTPFEVQDHDTFVDIGCTIIQYDQGVQSMSVNKQITVVNDSVTSKLARYKELVGVYEQRAKFELTDRERKIDEQMGIIISDRNRKENRRTNRIDLKEIAPKKRTTGALPATTTTTTSVTNAQLKALIDKGMNGDDSHNSGMGIRRNEQVVHECTYPDFMKCQPLNFKGMKGVVEWTQWFEKMEIVFSISSCSVENQIKFSTCTFLRSALTWWNSHIRNVGHDVAYAMTWVDLKKKMTDKYCPRGEIKKLEVELWNLKVKGTNIFRNWHCCPKIMQEAIEMPTELVEKKIRTFAERQTENKRKQDDNNNQAQQQPPKKQGVAIAYTDGSGERNEYAGTLPLCNKCKFHHNGQCTVKCANYKRVGHLTQDCRSPVATNNQRTTTYYECGNQGNYRSDYPKLKNQNHGNQTGGTGAREMVHALGGREINQDLNNMEDDTNA